MLDLTEYEKALGIGSFFDHQVEAFEGILEQDRKAACLYFPTGKGKTATSLVTMALLGQTDVLVIAPPATHQDWIAEGRLLGIMVTAISHAKFRQPDYKIKNAMQAIIVDEFHLLGSRTSDGWKKFDRRIAPHLKAPFIICSATPSYNDLGRVYCVHHVLDPVAARGGYDQYQLTHCHLEVAYRGLPNVVGFKHHANAAEFLQSLPGVYYMEDKASYQIVNHHHSVTVPPAWKDYNFDERTGQLMHSLMTRRVSWANLHYLDWDGELHRPVGDWIADHLALKGPTLIYVDKTTVAMPVFRWLQNNDVPVEVLTGKTSKKAKEQIINNFRAGRIEVLVATATLATGTDGLDKVCDTLLILQDTTDDSLRRQLVGRILPRGAADANKKVNIHRLNIPPVP